MHGMHRRSEESLGLSPHLPPVFMQLLPDCFGPGAAGQGVSLDCPVSHFTSAALGLQMWVLGTQTLIPTLAWQVLYLLSHLSYVPTHVYSFKGSELKVEGSVMIRL